MKKFTIKAGTFIAKHSFLYYFLNFTWGLLTTLVGFIIFLVLLPSTKQVTTYRQCTKSLSKKSKSYGFSFGINIFVDYEDDVSLYLHEYGHTCQNALFGPFAIFLVYIPSVVRYWYRELKYYRKGLQPPTKYDDIWFEGSATKIGENSYDIR